jgi:hypothetical protein
MEVVLILLIAQAGLGAFDTLYFHEWRARLVAKVPTTTDELRLHAVRDFVYVILFATLPVIAWQGMWAGVLVVLLTTEIIVTLADFVVEERVRRPLGGVSPGERVTHALMGIVYGAMLGYLVPVLRDWASRATALAVEPAPVSAVFTLLMFAMAAGIFVSGVRDIYGLLELPRGRWPWEHEASS